MNNGQCVLILLLAGRSHRFGHKLSHEDESAVLPKQFHSLGKKKESSLLFEISAQRLISALRLNLALFVFPPSLKTKYEALACQTLFEEAIYRLRNTYPDCKMMTTEGGDTRHKSFQNSINFLKAQNVSSDLILIVHDASRPFLDEPYLERIYKEIQGIGPKKPCSIPVIKTIDSLILRDKTQLEYLPREKIYQIQTPQLLYLESIYKAFERKYKGNNLFRWPDEGSFMKNMGFDIYTFEGDIQNKKVTYPADLP